MRANNDSIATNVDDNDADDEAVNKIVDHQNENNDSSFISSVSNSSNSALTTVSVDSLESSPKDYKEGLYDETLCPEFKHHYGTKPAYKKVLFNVFKCQTKENMSCIKLQDYFIYKKCQKAKKRFIFAGILCKHSDYYKFIESQKKSLPSKFLA